MEQVEKTSNFNKVTSSDKSKQTCSFVLLLLLLKIELASSSLYVVTGAYEGGQSEQYGPNGIYEETREPEPHYKKLGDPDPDRHYTFLYTDSHITTTATDSHMVPWQGKEFVHCCGPVLWATGFERETVN